MFSQYSARVFLRNSRVARIRATNHSRIIKRYISHGVYFYLIFITDKQSYQTVICAQCYIIIVYIFIAILSVWWTCLRTLNCFALAIVILLLTIILIFVRSPDLSPSPSSLPLSSLVNTLRLLHLRRKEFRLEKWVTPDESRWQRTVIWFAGDSLAISWRWCTGIRSHTLTRVSPYIYDGANNIHGGECVCSERHPDRWTHTEARVDNRPHPWIKPR